MAKAFERLEAIGKLKTDEEKHQEWLKDYEGLYFSLAENKKDLIYWAKEKEKYIYSDRKFNEPTECIDGVYRCQPNKIQRLKSRLVIEDESEGWEENLKKIEEKFVKNNWGFIRSSHQGKRDYLWCEFNRDLTTAEAKKFLNWIAPEGSEMDLNFTSDNFRFPVMFAEHWKYPDKRELPVYFQEGDKIDFDSLNIKPAKVKTKVTRTGYTTAVKEVGEPPKDILKILQNPDLFNLITEKELDKKIVGEEESRKVIFLCGAGGRLVRNCQIASFNLLVNDDAGIGKDYIASNTLNILPKEVYIHKTRISETVFTYWHNPEYEPDWSWDGIVFYPEDISEKVLNSDVFKVMCSSGSSATITIKQKAVEVDIKGKPVLITTTATATPNPELTRRFVILNLDSSENQTKLIMQRHSEYRKKGIVPEYNPKFTEAMRYLRRVNVKIPFADLIDKHFPSKNIIMRTNYPRFLDFISASASFHQYQRKEENGFILAEGQDYDIARDCFLKLCSNRYMIPLTINQKKILEVFEKEPHLKASASQFLPLMKGSISTLRTMQKNLRNLVRYGLLEDDVGKDSYGRDLEIFSLAQSYQQNKSFNLPKFEEIMQNE